MAMRHDWTTVVIPLGGNILAVTMRTQAFGAWVQIRQENAWISAEKATLKSKGKISVVSAWRHV